MNQNDKKPSFMDRGTILAFLVILIFWFGWTGYKADIHWIVPTLSGILIGFGLLSIFLQALNYLVDAYLMVCSLPSMPAECRANAS